MRPTRRGCHVDDREDVLLPSTVSYKFLYNADTKRVEKIGVSTMEMKSEREILLEKFFFVY